MTKDVYNIQDIPVTHAHIAAGRRLTSTGCPLALALETSLGGQWSVFYQAALWRCTDGTHQWWDLDPDVIAWIRAVDHGKTVQPCMVRAYMFAHGAFLSLRPAYSQDAWEGDPVCASVVRV